MRPKGLEREMTADYENNRMIYDWEPPEPKTPDQCYNCGCKLVEFAGEELYVCVNCGDEWAKYPEPPEL